MPSLVLVLANEAKILDIDSAAMKLGASCDEGFCDPKRPPDEWRLSNGTY
jgi:hypothetical protein